MKLSEQYARKINTLNEFDFTANKVPDDKVSADKKEKKTEIPWYLPDNKYVRYGLYVTALGIFGQWVARPIYKSLLAPGKALSLKDWHSRFKLIKDNRKNGIPPHKSESLWRHCLNVATQKELHTAKDVYKKVAAGKMKWRAGMAELDRIYGNQIAPAQRAEMVKKLKESRPRRIPPSPPSPPSPPYPPVTPSPPSPPPPPITYNFDAINPISITRSQFARLGPNQVIALQANPALTYTQLQRY